MSIIHVEQLNHSFGDKQLFRGLEFRLLKGEHAALVGNNGAGKSTLLRILTGEILPDSGSVRWHPGIKAGFLEQHQHLQPGTSILEALRDVFRDLYDKEREMNDLADRMGSGDQDLDRLLSLYADCQAALDIGGFYQLDMRIQEVAAGLGLADIGLDRDVSQLSGGQRTKLLLGKLLLKRPEILLLDEPTNFLDDRHIAWLTGYLKQYEHAFLVISHDEVFMNDVAGTILHLENQVVKRYTGNYAAFREQYEQNRQFVQDAYVRQQKEISRLESFIQKNRNRKAKQAKSREKALERMESIELHRTAPKPRFAFSVHAEPVNKIMEASQVRVGYSKVLFGPVDLLVKRGEKIAVTGQNGIGKSTLLKTLLGVSPPLSGLIKAGDRVKTAYFAQEQSPPDETPLEHVWSFRPDLTQKEIRQTLASAGLTEKHIRQPISTLSGGEQAKVRLSKLMLTPANVLVLDEPTNHLDVHAKESLKQALAQYKGTVLLVSHEPEFYEDLVTRIWSVEDWS
ncbi:ABC-F family ATP-binding cassette domain-containing protein [Paenibacillus sp. DMB20]|uniref:ABC-F family ATP-binding cassette domain-containing protein n=1 Tax=Paenibacillus sp. DMB20 TaxID=1642570 RepID=UPI000627AE58|nr:ABC-F family ATP-binding cassette domain-containing protein [Paenibacillus sp. DMB20]KKO52429.1 ABC transporter ATP-binding protein [Paenibacillus sp. DMB20]